MRICSVILLFISLCLNAQSETIETVVFKGVKKIKIDFLHKIIQTKATQKLDSTLLEKDLGKLIRLPAVSYCQYDVIPLKNGKFRIDFNIKENVTIIPYLNVWRNLEDKTSFSVGASEFNLLGRNLTVGAYYINNIHSSYGAYFNAPYLFDKNWGMETYFSNNQTIEPVYFAGQSSNYKYQLTSFTTALLYEPNIKNRYSFQVKLLNESYKFIDGDPINFPSQFEIKKLLIAIKSQKDFRKFHYQYISGKSNSIQVNYLVPTNKSNISGENNFWSLSYDYQNYKRIRNNGNWANNLSIGIAKEIDTPFLPFVIDNNKNIRGVGNFISRSNLLLVFNSEYRHTLIDKKWFALQSNVFLDMASWKNTEHNALFKANAIYSGIGLRLIHKYVYNAVIRIDWGFGLVDINKKQNGIVFGVGQFF